MRDKGLKPLVYNGKLALRGGKNCPYGRYGSRRRVMRPVWAAAVQGGRPVEAPDLTIDMAENVRMTSSSEYRPRPTRLSMGYGAAAVLLVVMVALNIPNLRGQSVTVDEYAHLPAGYMCLEEGNFRLYNKNPPLVKMLAALPLLALKPQYTLHDMYAATGAWGPWQFADRFVKANRDRAVGFWAAGRAVLMLMGAALALTVFLWAGGLYGPRAGLLAMFLTVTSPNILAHSGIITTDLGFTLFFTLTFYLLWRFFDKNRGWSLFFAAACFGAAQISKFSALIMLPLIVLIFIVFFIMRTLSSRRDGSDSLSKSAKDLVLAFCLIIVLGLAVVNIGYFGKRTLEPLGVNCGKSATLMGVSSTFIGDLPIPLPADYVRGLDAQLADAERGEFPNYLNGQWRRRGVWYYFLEALALKTPLPALALVLLGLLAGIRRAAKAGQMRGKAAPPWLFVHLPAGAFLLTTSLFGNLQLGLRYVLPVLPLAFIAASRVVNARDGRKRLPGNGRKWPSRALGVIVVALCVWQGVELARTAPHYLSYFNQIAGGAEKGHEYLIDSNIDWGQDLPGLKKAMDELGIDEVGLLYFGHADPGLYSIKYHLPRPGDPFVAVSVNFLHGYPYALTYLRPWTGRPPMITAPGYSGVFRFTRSLLEKEPAERIGGSIYLYDLRGPTR